MGLFTDEIGHLSAARVFFGTWTAIVCVAAWYDPAPEFWPLATTVMIGLLGWAAGPRLAQYLVPQAAAVAQSTVEAIKAKIQARRNPDQGYEESR